MPKLTFARAEAIWKETRLGVDDDRWPEMAAAEAALLDHAPTSLSDAALILEVVLDQCGDARTDGRDQRALGRLRDFLCAHARLGMPASTMTDATSSPSEH